LLRLLVANTAAATNYVSASSRRASSATSPLPRIGY
jgi:hypothetical protein